MSGESPLGPFRRIITSHADGDSTGSAVAVHDDTLTLRPVLDGNAHMTPLFAHLGCPTTTPATLSREDITAAMALAPEVVTPNGVNAQVTDVAPNYRIEMHRTNSVDYNICLKGSAYLITPEVGPDGKVSEKRTLMRAGDIVIQRGTVHAWQAGPEGARWCTVVISAKPVALDGKPLPEQDFK